MIQNLMFIKSIIGHIDHYCHNLGVVFYCIKIETGRYNQIPIEYRLCILCEENVIEDENHFLF